MPRLWTQAIDSHRRAVRDAILHVAAGLLAEHGLRGVSMARIAAEAGISRATLYRYFPDVEAILGAWHARQIAAHLRELSLARDRSVGSRERLVAVLEMYALLIHQAQRHGHDGDLAALLHGGDEVARARRLVTEMLRQLIAEAAAAGAVRTDISPAELASYCVSALGAARSAKSTNAVRRLVTVTVDGLRGAG